MKITIYRYSFTEESTLGILLIDDEFFCYTLEDAVRDKKIPKITAIPAGVYNLKIRKDFNNKNQEVFSPATLRYRDKYTWFKHHIEIDKVPGFKYIYLHVGNTSQHTDGCILLGLSSTSNKLSTGFVGSSATAFEKFYKKVYPKVSNKECISIEIKNLNEK